jgi:uncharacterized membrane protein YbhN (UPF0104 family)
MVAGIVLMALGLKKVLGYVGGEEGHTVADPIYGIPLAALYGGAALYLLGHVGFTRYVTGSLNVERLVVVVLLLALLPVAAMLPALVTLAVLAVVLGAGTLSSRRFVFAGAVVAVALVVALVASVVLHRRGHLARVWTFVKPMLAATGNLRGRHGAQALGVTLVVWAVEAGVWLCCADAAGLRVSVLEAMYLLALASLFVFIPAGPGNVGTLDAAVLVGARAIGRSSSAALSFLILLRLVLIVPITAVGLGFLVVRYR